MPAASRHAPLLVAVLLVLGLPTAAPAQTPGPDAAEPAAFDPSEVYFQAWLLSRDADELTAQEKYPSALAKLRRARQLFDTVARTFPEWKPTMVERRRQMTFDAIAEVRPRALKQQEAQRDAIAELEGGRRLPGTTAPPDQAQATLPATPTETLESRRIAQLRRQVAELEQRARDAENQLQASRKEARQASRQTQQLREQQSRQDQQRQQQQAALERRFESRQAAQRERRDSAVAELHRARAELDRLRRDLAAAPMQEELDALSRRINGLEAEKAAMAETLEHSRSETRDARAQVDALNQERGRLLRQVADLRQQLADAQGQAELERQTSNQVVAGQLQQIQQLQGQLRTKDQALTKARSRIDALETALAEVRASVQDLTAERDELLRERDQMAALLKLNQAGQLQEVIDQNMALDRQLRETTQRYETLKSDTDATKNDLLEALRDLAISKMRIQEFRREKTEQQQRLADLQERLKREQRKLSTQNADPAEVAMLRGIIQRQLKVQEKRAQAREMLLATLEDKARDDDHIRRAVQLFQGASLNLSPEELRVIQGKVVDDVIVSPYARPRSEVERSLADLDRQLEPYRQAGIRAYRHDRLRAAREAFEMIVERHAGDDTAMCMLALVEYKLDEPAAAARMFRRAAELKPENPYAHRMLGHILSSRLDDQVAAIAALERAAKLAPTHVQGHLLLGNAYFRHGQLDAAEEAFRTALACEPTHAEAHYNLALLCQRTERPREALKHYTRALEHGAPPNPVFAEKLASP